MSDKNKTTEKNGDGALEKFIVGMFAIGALFSKVAWTGLKRIKFKSEEFIFLAPLLVAVTWAIAYADLAYLDWLYFIWPEMYSEGMLKILRTIPTWIHFLGLLTFAIYIVGISLGFVDFVRLRRLQKKLDSISLKNGEGVPAKVVAEIDLDGNRSKLLITSKGIGIDRFEAKKNDLEMSYQRIVEEFSISEDRKFLEILMSKKVLRKSLSYYNVVATAPKPYHFFVGETVNGLLSVDIRELPHLLIAGSTGGGKSVFFRQVFTTLLKFSPHLQVYLIDLKQGVEVKEFAQIPNVRVAKDEAEAVQLLEALRVEMKSRFDYMEKHNLKRIDPDEHKKDLIVVGIDEASVLFGKTSISSSKKEMVAKARDLTDEIAKLARAAGIHLVIATQKAVKESLDTKTLENLVGRMVFKMSTHAGSNTALGNAKAYGLPDIKGRGIWAGGNKFIEVQAPYLAENELDDECKAIADVLKKSNIKNHQTMIEIGNIKASTKPSLAENETKTKEQTT